MDARVHTRVIVPARVCTPSYLHAKSVLFNKAFYLQLQGQD